MSWERVYRLVKKIPRGRVTTYGYLARKLRLPGGARVVGYAMAGCPNGQGIPWHRVVGAGGRLLISEPHAGMQRRLLEAEGVMIDGSRIDMRHYAWTAARRKRSHRPRNASARGSAGSSRRRRDCVIELRPRDERDSFRGRANHPGRGSLQKLWRSGSRAWRQLCGRGRRSVRLARTQWRWENLHRRNSGGDAHGGSRQSARVRHLDPQTSGERFKEKIGAALQSTALPDKLRVKEAIELFMRSSIANGARTRTNSCGDFSSMKSATPSTAISPAAKSSGWRSRWRW